MNHECDISINYDFMLNPLMILPLGAAVDEAGAVAVALQAALSSTALPSGSSSKWSSARKASSSIDVVVSRSKHLELSFSGIPRFPPYRHGALRSPRRLHPLPVRLHSRPGLGGQQRRLQCLQPVCRRRGRRRPVPEQHHHPDHGAAPAAPTAPPAPPLGGRGVGAGQGQDRAAQLQSQGVRHGLGDHPVGHFDLDSCWRVRDGQHRDH